ncbi:MAG: energy-coupling factor transporter transmembrane protein EcfT [Furfurilactobacillus sp.]|jgi:energy-coupling factor transport system permease protein|uniref:Energy-coupling factor transporter transmembrane protein EcfT n=1 Tax=Furfurilactobacillus milii TaxID=2888272 RepID=A0ABT6D9V1_9LACO|nr:MULTISPECIES: energy-coupling factor transporter transmembrane protein EcfT [Furfurilactobacillus]QLE66827.1 Transmembrane component of general energizing module of ECF transporters [Furfurilactobacillus rossiae]MCF6160712.1 energy-coupling factor transporter transmembrane protein EcfT [Furfurilactobacillus milii]MCF6162944.1 energy-coupling factor transporter transmembrane protein EcfT [Furfurilactobacillus milii]MCF6420135.1 energy-coupling factor transporter transmembrane protein EcfT [Fu
MSNALLLGRFIPGTSIIHRLDPRVKLLTTLYLILIIFLADNWQTNLLLYSFVLIGVLCARLSLRFFFRGLRPMFWLIIFTVAMQLLFTHGGTVYWQWGWLIISQTGLQNGLYVFLRFVFIVFVSTLLTLTTAPLALADAVASLLRPLRWFRFPVDEVALMLALALRFVPNLMDETSQLMAAQRSRGVEFGEGNVFQQMQALIPLLIPQLVTSFRRADELGTAMEARGYSGTANRTKFRIQQFHGRDGAFVLILLILTGLLILMR